MYFGTSRKVLHLEFPKEDKFQQTKNLKKSPGWKTSLILNYCPSVLTSAPCPKSQNQVASPKTPKRNKKRKRSFTHHNETFPFSPQRSGLFNLSIDTDNSQLGDSDLQNLYEILPSVLEEMEFVGKREVFAKLLQLVHGRRFPLQTFLPPQFTISFFIWGFDCQIISLFKKILPLQIHSVGLNLTLTSNLMMLQSILCKSY